METNVIVQLAVEGLHCWPQAKELLPEVAYLSDLHRHTFNIKAHRAVQHDDRDVEIIMFKRTIERYLHARFFDAQYKCLNFEAMSCEMIAKELFNEFGLFYCSVLEDNENGAEVY